MKKMLLAAALLASGGVACAQGYVGALIGLSHFNADCTGALSCDNGDSAFKLYGGYEVAPNIAVEVAYTDFGSFKATGALYNNIDASAISVVAAFRGAFATDWTGVGRLGLASVKSEWDVTNAGSKSKIALYAGAGVEYSLSKEFKLTGAIDLTQAEINGSSGGIYAIGVGAQMGF